MKRLYLRLLILILCLPSGGILLLKAYGIDQMFNSVYYLFLPSIVILFGVLFFCYKNKLEAYKLIILGAFAGLIGTFGYDLVRIPFMLMGSRIFVPINMYGMWISDSTISSEFTDTVGWLYHFSNGITFGIMYTLFMKGRSFWWAYSLCFVIRNHFCYLSFWGIIWANI